MICFLARPDLSRYPDHALPAVPRDQLGLKVMFLGVSTLLITDGTTSIMTDAFFSRPGFWRMALRRINPDRDRIAAALQKAKVTSLAAVICTHSHYDHALDAAVVADRTRATLIGSSSTAQIGRGHKLPEYRLRVAAPDQQFTFGAFTVTMIASDHSPNPWFPGHIDRVIHPPERVCAYRMGDCYAVHIRHGDRTMLVNGSAGYQPGALDGYRADVVYLGIATLGKQKPALQEALWKEVVVKRAARRVIPIHWDDFWQPLDRALVPMRRLMDDFDASMAFLLAHERPGELEIKLPRAWEYADPWAGL